MAAEAERLRADLKDVKNSSGRTSGRTRELERELKERKDEIRRLDRELAVREDAMAALKMELQASADIIKVLEKDSGIGTDEWPKPGAHKKKAPTKPERTETIKSLPDTNGSNGRTALLLISIEGNDDSAEHYLSAGRTIIGRTSNNDIQIESEFVSRHHAQIIGAEGGNYVLEDLNSTNGIYVNSRRVKKCELQDGDIIEIAKHRMTYVEPRMN